MANVQHSALTGSDLHEPKGIAAATINKVYVSDGAGSGTWTATTALTVTASITSLTALTAIAVDDEFPIYDLSTTTNKKITTLDIFDATNAFTADATPDIAADYVPTYDASAGTAKKVLLNVLPHGQVVLASGTVSAAATLDIDLSAFTATAYRAYRIVLSGWRPATNAVALYMRTSTNAGSSYDASIGNYSWAAVINSGNYEAVAGNADGSDDEVELHWEVGSASTESVSVDILIHDPTSTALYTAFSWTGVAIEDIGLPACFTGAGARLTAADVDAVRFLFSSGNITSGKYVVYGLV